MIYLDLALRGGATTLLLLLAVFLWRAPIGWEGRVSVLALAVAKTAFLIQGAAVPVTLPPLVEANLILFASLLPNAITWLIVTIFLDPPWRRWPWLVASSIVSASLYLHSVAPELGIPCMPLGVALYGSLLVMALWSARDDLVECRCRARPGFAAAIAGLAFSMTGAQAAGLLQDGSLALALAQSLGTLSVTLAFAVWILRPNMSLWPGETEPTPAPRPRNEDAPDVLDTALIARIEAAMSAGIWREEGLTIGGLAAKLSVPEHRLRRAINQGLGHRNFSSFINRARIAEAQRTLANPEAIGTTILEIAYDVGFASLGPFNRAFRAETGQSPSEYRRDALGQTPTDPENTAPIPVNLH